MEAGGTPLPSASGPHSDARVPWATRFMVRSPSSPLLTPPSLSLQSSGYPERGREGAKFVVDERPQRRQARGCVGVDPSEVQAQRKQQQLLSPEAARAAEAEAGVMLAELLG